jgi:hypothetical protein
MSIPAKMTIFRHKRDENEKPNRGSMQVPTSPVPDSRRLKREEVHKRASLVVNLVAVNFGRREERFPCLILDSTQDGFRLRGTFRLRHGQIVEVILDEDAVRCNVMCTGHL